MTPTTKFSHTFTTARGPETIHAEGFSLGRVEQEAYIDEIPAHLRGESTLYCVQYMVNGTPSGQFYERGGLHFNPTDDAGVLRICLGRWHKAQSDERMGRIELTLPMAKKTLYVRAAHAQGKKLVPWMIEALDKAAATNDPS